MRDEKLTADLYAECKAELVKLDVIIDRHSRYDLDGFPKKCKDLIEFRHRVLLIMERLASGEASPYRPRTAWDHVNKDES